MVSDCFNLIQTINFVDIYAAKTKMSEINKPFKKQMAEHKYAFLTSDPENTNGHDMIRKKFGLPQPNQFKYGRAQGGISNIELEKLGIGMR